MRLDRAVTARGLARSRAHAQELIAAGQVRVDGQVCLKSSTEVGEASRLDVSADAGVHYVSRAAFKLAGALDACTPHGLTVAGRRALDAGASTGGFTQVLLERGVDHVLAVDVGHGQLAPLLGENPRVTSVEGFNLRHLSPDTDLGVPASSVDLVVADLSFISLTLVIDPLVSFAAPGADFLLMVKPQFEVGRRGLDGHGVVHDAGARRDAVATVVAHMRQAGLFIHRIDRSALPGPAGNREYFVWGCASWQASGAGQRPVLDDVAVAEHLANLVEGL